MDILWNPYIWLPPNITWLDVPQHYASNNFNYNLIYSLPMAVLVLMLRYSVEKYCFKPLAVYLGIKNNGKQVEPNEILEKTINRNSKIKSIDVTGVAKQLDWNERKVKEWLLLRKAQDKPSTLKKFCENGWRCIYYSLSVSFGIFVLWNKPWMWNSDLCWEFYPYQTHSHGVMWYYMTCTSYHWSQFFAQFYDVKRNDFWLMFTHHLLTIALIHISWICNYIRIGSLTLIIHDFAGIFLEALKMAKYAKYQRLCDTLFGMFTLAWLSTRTGFFPYVVLYSVIVRAPIIINIPMFPAHYIFAGLLICLQGIHLYWTYLIFRIVKSSFAAGQMEGDIRSSMSGSETEESSNSPRQAGDHNKAD